MSMPAEPSAGSPGGSSSGPSASPVPGQASKAPERSTLVLVALILVAAVANLNLAVANVALPDIGKAFDSSQTALDLIAVGYSLGLAASVLWLGALGDRYGRKMMLVLGVSLSVPACLLAAYAPSDGVLVAARLLGGLSAGMAYPTTLALITALWSGPARTKSIALWSGIGGAISALGPLVAGALLEHYWWGSVFLVTLPLAVVALVLALRFVPSHVNEATDPVDNLGGILSAVLVAGIVLAINFAPVPDKGTLALGLAVIALAAGVAFVIRQRRARSPLYDLDIAGRRIFWVAACAGIIVFGSLMGAMFIGQQFLQNVLGYSTLDAGAAILPAAVLMVIVAPRSAKIIDARGSRFTLLSGYLFCLLGFVTMLVLWTEHSHYWEVGLGYAFIGVGVGLRRHPRLAFAHRFGTGSRARGWRRAPPICSATSAGRSCSRSSARSSPRATPPRSPRRSPRRPTARRPRPACRTSSPSRSRARRRLPRSTRSTRARSPPQPSRRSSTAPTGRTPPASSRSCSAPRSSSSASRARNAKRR